MKKLLLPILVFIFSSFSIENTNTQIQKCVDTNVQNFLSKIPIGMESNYGFENRNSMLNAKSGIPIKVFTLINNFYTSDYLDKTQKYLKEQNEWRVPLVSDNKFNTLGTVIYQNNEYQLVDIGGANLAKEIEIIINKSTIKNFGLFRLYSLQADFLIDISSNNIVAEYKFIPLQSALSAFSELQSNKEYYFLNELLPIIKNHTNQIKN